MTANYVDRCIEEAMAEAKGNKNLASDILLARSMTDKLLEDGLFANFRKATTMYQVQRWIHRRDQKSSAANTSRDLDGSDFNAMMAQLENNLGNTKDPFGASTLSPAASQPVNKTESSPAHGNNLRALADAFLKKPFKKSTSN